MNGDWNARVEALWDRLSTTGAEEFVATMRALATERGERDPEARFQVGSALDSTGSPAAAAACYREALEWGLSDPLRRRATIQLASSLRNLGDPAAAAQILRAERDRLSDDLDDAVAAFLALALADLGEAQEGLGLVLQRLAGHMPRYRASLGAYGRALCNGTAGDVP